jgi:hypothetical protein
MRSDGAMRTRRFVIASATISRSGARQIEAGAAEHSNDRRRHAVDR